MISIIIPVIREEKFKKCLDAIRKNADSKIPYEVISEIDVKRIGCPKMVAKLIKQARGNQLLYLGDDTVPQAGFITEAVRAMTFLPDGWGMVGLNDGRNIRTEAAHFLIDKRMLPLIGGELFHTGYWHCFCDNELSLRARLLGRYCYAENAKIYHDHPAIHPEAKSDKDYKRVYSKEYWEHDELLWRQRRQEIINK